MSAIHVLHTTTYIASEREDGEPRWCFYCRKRVPFVRRLHAPVDIYSYYGPHVTVKCARRDHSDGDLFPGRFREWDA